MAEGEVIFAQQINFAGPVLVPTTTPQNVSLTDIASNVTSQVAAYGHPFTQLRPQSYTDTLHASEADARYALMTSAILILFLIPIFDRVLLVRDEKEQRGGGAAPAMHPRTLRIGNDRAGGLEPTGKQGGSQTNAAKTSINPRAAKTPLSIGLLYLR
jgi:hypothetical protein